MRIISMYGYKQGSGGIESILKNQRGLDFHEISSNDPYDTDEGAEEMYNQFWQSLPADLLHIHSPNTFAGYVLANEAREANIPSIATFHYGGFTNWPEYADNEELARDTLACVDHIICVSEAGKKSLPYNNSTVIYNGIDPEQFRPAEKENDQFSIIYPAKICMMKGQKDFVKLAQYLKDEQADFRIDLMGKVADNQYASELQEEIKKRELEKYISILPPVPIEEMNKTYTNHDLLIFPSRLEGLGLISLEAQACGLPVIGYDAGGIKETIIEGETGFCVRTQDIYSLFERTIELYKEPDKRAFMGEKARQNVIRNFSLDQMLQKQEQLYQRVADSFTANH